MVLRVASRSSAKGTGCITVKCPIGILGSWSQGLFPSEVALMLKVNRREDTRGLPYMVGNRIRVIAVSFTQSVSCFNCAELTSDRELAVWNQKFFSNDRVAQREDVARVFRKKAG